MTNKEYAENDIGFIEYCRNAGIKPTKRQASKFRNGKGLAYKQKIRTH